MKVTLKKFLCLILITVFGFSLLGCGVKPEDTAKNLLDAIKQNDLEKASTYMKKDDSAKEGSTEEFKYDSPEQEKIIKGVFSKIDYTLDSTTTNGNNAIVKAKITSVDLTRVATKMISELLPTLMTQALSGENDEKKQNEMMLQYFINSINDPNVPKTTTDVDIKLVKENKTWLVEQTDDLTNALTGNFQRMSEALNQQQ